MHLLHVSINVGLHQGEKITEQVTLPRQLLHTMSQRDKHVNINVIRNEYREYFRVKAAGA
jgi:hypothetical protein